MTPTMKLKRPKVLPLEEVYVRASRVELKYSFQGTSSLQTEFFGADHCPNPKMTSVAASVVPVNDHAYMPRGQPKSEVQFFDTPQKQGQAAGMVVCYDEGKTSNSETSFLFSEDYVPNLPALSAAWKGRFEIHNYSQDLYLQAHPPEKVWRKAYLVTKQMPKLLHLTPQSRHNVWPDVFNIDPPSVSDIALYFWSDDFCRSSESYNQLLDYMENKDLCLRSCVDDVELLILTSKLLPVDYQRVNRQSYLWGVFQPLKGQQLCAGLQTTPHLGIDEYTMKVTNEDDDQAIDMEIDMIGGKEFGRIDKYMSKTSCMADSDTASSCALSGIHSVQSAQECRVAKHQYQVKSERCHDIGDSPRFSTSLIAPGSSDVTRKNSIAGKIEQVEIEQYKDTVPPGFQKSFGPPGSSRLVTSGSSNKGHSAASVVKMSPAAFKMDAPPGFSNLHKLKEGDSSFKIKREQCVVISTPEYSRLVDSPVVLTSITADAASGVSSTISLTKMTPVTSEVDAHPDFCKLLELNEINTSSKVKRESCDDINASIFSSSVSSAGSAIQVASDAAVNVPSNTASVAKKSSITCTLDAPPGFSKSLELNDRNTSFKVKREPRDYISTPPGMLRPISSDATNKVPCPISLPKVAPVPRKLDAPPLSSKPQEPKERDTSSKILSHHVKKEPYADVDAPVISRLVNASGWSRPITSAASVNGPIAVTNLRTSSVACKDAPPGFSKSVKLEGKT